MILPLYIHIELMCIPLPFISFSVVLSNSLFYYFKKPYFCVLINLSYWIVSFHCISSKFLVMPNSRIRRRSKCALRLSKSFEDRYLTTVNQANLQRLSLISHILGLPKPLRLMLIDIVIMPYVRPIWLILICQPNLTLEFSSINLVGLGISLQVVMFIPLLFVSSMRMWSLINFITKPPLMSEAIIFISLISAFVSPLVFQTLQVIIFHPVGGILSTLCILLHFDL